VSETPDIGARIAAAIRQAGGRLEGAPQLSGLELNPEGETATYFADIAWPYGRRREVIGIDAGDSLWIYPRDPELPGLRRLAYAEAAAEFCNRHRIFPEPVTAAGLELELVTYRPHRRAVLRVNGVFAKVYRPEALAQMAERQRVLAEAGVPVARILATDPAGVIVSAALPGEPLSAHLLDAAPPVSAADLLALLDALPRELTWMPRRRSWAEALGYYAAELAKVLPEASELLNRLCGQLEPRLRPGGDDPTHGDFHASQILVADGRVSGLLDPDTAGPGQRVDDLATFLAHLLTTDTQSAAEQDRLNGVVADWVPHFDRRVDPVQLRLRAAAVVVSLAGGPYAAQLPGWQSASWRMLRAAEALAEQVSV
jgi:hypothetical protein